MLTLARCQSVSSVFCRSPAYFVSTLRARLFLTCRSQARADCDDDIDMSASTHATSLPRESGADSDKKKERRRSQRKPYVAEASLASPTAKDPADRLEVSALNISRHGIAFELPKSIPTGAFYVLQLGMGPQRMTTEVQIISCRSGNGTFHVGAKFC